MREQPQVPQAEFSSYYGRQIIKTPVWKQPDVPLYLFLGGVAGASSVLAEGAALTGRPALQRVARWAGSVSAGAGTVALIHDLGRPERFLNMLRVFKPTSPLSVGSWVLAGFSGLNGAALASSVTGLLPRLGRAAGMGSALLGPVLSTYTGALISDTAVPAWHEGYREMPFLFAGSAAASAGGVAMAATPVAQAGPARRMAVVGAALDVAAGEVMQRRMGMVAEPYQQGHPGMLMKVARGLMAGGGALSLLGGRSRLASVAAGAALVGGSVVTRFGVFRAGLASAEDPKYTVVPQRQRLSSSQRPAHRQ